MSMALIYWALFAAVSLVALGYGLVEYQAYTLRSQVKSVPGGLQFSSYFFTVEISRPEKSVKIICKNGEHKITPLAGGEAKSQTGAMSLVMPAAGMQIDISQIGKREAPGDPLLATGLSFIVFRESKNIASTTQGGGAYHSLLELDRIPDTVAQALRHFSEGLEVWFDKLERDHVAEITAREKQIAVAALAQEIASEAVLPPPLPPSTAPLSPADQAARAKAQLAQWRQNAGFAGTQTDMRFDSFGNVDWLIDLNPDGRIILHTGNLHFHGTLKGSVVTMLTDDLEVKVRDEFWQEGDRNLPTFRVLQGASRETLLGWRDRLMHAGEIFVHDPGRHSPPIKG